MSENDTQTGSEFMSNRNCHRFYTVTLWTVLELQNYKRKRKTMPNS